MTDRSLDVTKAFAQGWLHQIPPLGSYLRLNDGQEWRTYKVVDVVISAKVIFDLQIGMIDERVEAGMLAPEMPYKESAYVYCVATEIPFG